MKALHGQPFPSRARQALGYGATLLAALASVATSWGSEFCELYLPDRQVALTSSQPEAMSRFVVESSDPTFSVRVVLATTSKPYASLEVKAVGPDAAQVRVSGGPAATTEDRVTWVGSVTIDCAGEFPCVARLEAIARANEAAPTDVEGILSIEVDQYDCGARDWYLAVQPL